MMDAKVKRSLFPLTILTGISLASAAFEDLAFEFHMSSKKKYCIFETKIWIIKVSYHKGPLVNQFWSRKRHCDVLWVVGLACDVLKFVFIHCFFS